MTRGAEMDALKSLMIVIVSLVGLFLPVVLVSAYALTISENTHPAILGLVGGIAALAGYKGGAVAVDFAWRRFFEGRNRPPGGPALAPNAERDARAKFLPSIDTAADDPSIQPDKRGLKPGDQ